MNNKLDNVSTRALMQELAHRLGNAAQVKRLERTGLIEQSEGSTGGVSPLLALSVLSRILPDALGVLPSEILDYRPVNTDEWKVE